MAQCGFTKAWIGKCKNEAIEGSPNCVEHQDKCMICGALADKECNYSAQFVCGFLLCNNCEGVQNIEGEHFHRAIPEKLRLTVVQKGEFGCYFNQTIPQDIYESDDGRQWMYPKPGDDHWYVLQCTTTGEYISLSDVRHN